MKNLLYTASECHNIDLKALKLMGLTEIQLMQRAANAAMSLIEQYWPQSQHISVYCGPGNNGGDGYLLAQLIIASGREISLYALKHRESTLLQTVRKRAMNSGIKIYRITDKFDDCFNLNTDLIVDALFGHGLSREISPPLKELLKRLNQSGKPIFALDIPSGINSDTGAVMGIALKAQRTLCFVAPKIGLYTGSGPDYAAKVSMNDLAITPGVYDQVKASFKRLTFPWLVNTLSQPKPSSHKGDMGHVAIIGGQSGMVGAIILAGFAAARCGAGRVTLIAHAQLITSVQHANPVLMTLGIDVDAGYILPRSTTAVVLGPGLGWHNNTQDSFAVANWPEEVFHSALAQSRERKLPMLIDADGLNLLAVTSEYYDQWILTPHPKEAARLLNCEVDEIQANRPKACRQIAKKYGGVCVLKGAGTLIGCQAGQQFICTDGNWGMATAGSGDVLSGVIGALSGSGFQIHDAARMGVLIHARAGDRAARSLSKRSLIASDISSALPKIFRQIEKMQSVSEK